MVNRDIQIFTLEAASPAEFVAFHFTLACVSLVLHALMHASKDGVHPELLDKRLPHAVFVWICGSWKLGLTLLIDADTWELRELHARWMIPDVLSEEQVCFVLVAHPSIRYFGNHLF